MLTFSAPKAVTTSPTGVWCFSCLSYLCLVLQTVTNATTELCSSYIIPSVSDYKTILILKHIWLIDLLHTVIFIKIYYYMDKYNIHIWNQCIECDFSVKNNEVLKVTSILLLYRICLFNIFYDFAHNHFQAY